MNNVIITKMIIMFNRCDKVSLIEYRREEERGKAISVENVGRAPCKQASRHLVGCRQVPWENTLGKK